MLRSNWQFDKGSIVDPVGRIVINESRLGRAIYPNYADEMRSIVNIADKNKWYDHGLVDSWITPELIEGFPLIIEHKRIPFVTYRQEWPALALQRAAQCTLDLSIALLRNGYCLKDSHS